MKRFNEDFRTRLYDTIKDIEDNSLVEIVVLIKAQSGNYRDIPVWAGMITSFIVYTFFMFSPFEFDVYLIYAFTLLSFPLVYTLFTSLPKLKVKFANRRRMDRNVEIHARAIFQKGGVRFTSERIGTLFYVSLLEHKIYILPDRGAKSAIPAEDWEKIETDFQSIFDEPESSLPNALLEKLANFKPVFSEFIPPVENDINELPDNLDVEL
jgi:putative membrane protein